MSFDTRMVGVDRTPIEVRQVVSEEFDDMADGDPYHPARSHSSFDAERRSSPDRIRTGATALRGRRPRPLDDGAEHQRES
jgi:hypothetical protein